MPVKIIVPVKVSDNPQGIGSGKQYNAVDELPTGEEWQDKIARQLIEAGLAQETKVVAPTEIKKVKKKKKG